MASSARRSEWEALEAVEDPLATCPGIGLQCIDSATLAACDEEDEEPEFVLSCEALINRVSDEDDDVEAAYCDRHKGACVLNYRKHQLVLRVRQISDRRPKKHQSNFYQRLTEFAGLGDGFGEIKFEREANINKSTENKKKENEEKNVIYFGDHKIKARPGFWKRCSEGGLHCANPRILALCSGDSDNIQYGMECSGGFCDAVAEACYLGSEERERREIIDPTKVGKIIANLTGYHPQNIEIASTQTDVFKNPLSILEHPNSTALNSEKLSQVLGDNITLASSTPTLVGPGDVIPEEKLSAIEQGDKPLYWRKIGFAGILPPNATLSPNITIPEIFQNNIPSLQPQLVNV